MNGIKCCAYLDSEHHFGEKTPVSIGVNVMWRLCVPQLHALGPQEDVAMTIQAKTTRFHGGLHFSCLNEFERRSYVFLHIVHQTKLQYQCTRSW